MRFAISIPQFYLDGEFDPGAFRAYLARVEDLGYHSVWAQESPIGTGALLSPMEAMTYAAACTTRLRLGTTVFVSTLHQPVHFAKALATIDQMSGGRLEVGVGSGGPNRPFAAFGMDKARYLARFTEGIDLVKALWTRPSVTFAGEFWQLEDAAMEPKPLQKPHPPLWFGGSSESALRRAVRLGDGFFGAGSSTTAAFREQVAFVAAEAAKVGRADFPVAKRIYIDIDEDAERARERTNAGLARVYGRRIASIEAAAVAGTLDECVAGVREVIDAGAELVLFTPLGDPAPLAERIAAEVIPALSV
ncbi:probable F420-dependent oxidoreductase [Streptomyces sp. TLI_55]|uniref:LLM class flavin-dependent oxidoreductase n=1 Tax=Streptomyces sp. TLI_55 TaxID=1938861 RepID=UPI000BD77728|nr:LLM class flavin-dependent oxidoreductase [Streptomyces sp. TLI_55]SNX55669.1 probable F420-dependent oxidoreductase [Streptomyces sp. TLI_55]